MCKSRLLPAQDTENEIEHEKTSHYNQRNEKDPIEGAADGIVCLKLKIKNVLTFECNTHCSYIKTRQV